MQHELPRSPFHLRFVRQGDVLRAEVAGESSLENTIAYWQAIQARDNARAEQLSEEARELADELKRAKKH